MANLTRIWPFVFVIGLGASCAPRPKLVYVDLNVAQAAFQKETISSRPKTQKPDLAPGSVSKLPGLSERTVTFPVTRERLEHARDIVQKSEDQAVLELTRRLRETYLVEVRRIEQERLAELDPTKVAFTKNIFDRIRQAFEAYANRRGPFVIRLSLLVGFPDPDPLSSRPPESDRPLLKRRFEEAKQLRGKISALDKQYDATVATELNTLREANDEAFTRLKVEIEELRSKAEQQAIEEARKQINTNRDEVKSLIIGNPSVTLESVGEKRVAFAPASKPKTLETPSVNLSDSREELQVDLDIWLAQRGFVLGTRGKGVDVTQEFIVWRKLQLGGH